jgi:DNA processing protein
MLESLVALNSLPKIGPVRIRRLLDHFGTAEAVLSARKDRLTRIDGIGPELAAILTGWEDHCDPAAELREVAERGLSLITADDPVFPAALREAYDAPVLLYVWGRLEPGDRHAIGIVGTRRASAYGKSATKKIGFQCAHAGFTVISGLARGIDTTAHEAALAAGGRTVAIIGSGLAKLFPAENLGLAEKIADGRGAVVSEFPLHTSPDKKTFPQRNRIVAAWSRALIVAESPVWSGSLITANLASEYGRSVYAIPGPITSPTSAGCHRLIREGATLLTDGAELLDDLGGLGLESAPAGKSAAAATSASNRPAAAPTAPDLPELAAEERHIFDALGETETGIDQLIEATGLPAATVSATLLKLEMKRLVRPLPGFRYLRRH